MTFRSILLKVAISQVIKLGRNFLQHFVTAYIGDSCICKAPLGPALFFVASSRIIETTNSKLEAGDRKTEDAEYIVINSSQSWNELSSLCLLGGCLCSPTAIPGIHSVLAMHHTGPSKLLMVLVDTSMLRNRLISSDELRHREIK